MNLELLQEVFLDGANVEYTAHCQKRMLERDISRADIKNCIMHGEIIEEYPLSEENNSIKSLPSCLVLGLKLSSDEKMHVVVGFDGYKALVISAYHPDLVHWAADYKTRTRG